MEIIGIILGIVAFFLVIAVHELGHLLSAQWFGVAIKSFAIGFGPEAKVLFYRKGVRYVLNWIPFGGYVSFYNREEVSNRKQQTLNDVTPFQRLIIFASGPLINIVFGCAIASGTIYYQGERVYDNGFVINEVYPNSPAENAKLLTGDILLTIANQEVTPDIDISDIAIAHKGESIPVTVLRDGQTLTVSLIPGPWSYGGASAAVGYGIGGDQLSHREDIGIFESIQLGWMQTQDVLSGALNIFTPDENQDTSDSGEVIGAVGMVRQTGDVYQQYGFEGFFIILFFLNVSIAVFNLIPFPGLDGSHIVISLIEIITRRPFPYTIKNIFFNIGLAVMFVFFIYLLIKDIWMWVSGA